MKKNKFVPLLTLVLCMSAFFIPTTAYAQSPADTTPPTVSATLSGETLRIQASDDNSGVDAVFIDGKRVNYRVDSAVDVALKDYAGTGAQVSVYAMDFAGNKSDVVQIKNPYYKQVAPVPTPKPTTKPSASVSADPEAPTDPKPFTPDGQATVTDNATDEDGKEFYTITTPNENTFFLVIDKQRDSDNVYFLNAVTESDLAALAEKPKESESAIPDPICACKEKCELGAVDTTCPLCVTSLKTCVGEAPAATPDAEPEKPKKEGNAGMTIFILLAVAVVGGAGYYFKIYKPKHDLDDAEDLDELLDNEEPEVNEDEAADTVREEYTERKVTPESDSEAESSTYYDDYPDDEPDDEPTEENPSDKRAEER